MPQLEGKLTVSEKASQGHTCIRTYHWFFKHSPWLVSIINPNHSVYVLHVINEYFEQKQSLLGSELAQKANIGYPRHMSLTTDSRLRTSVKIWCLDFSLIYDERLPFCTCMNLLYVQSNAQSLVFWRDISGVVQIIPITSKICWQLRAFILPRRVMVNNKLACHVTFRIDAAAAWLRRRPCMHRVDSSIDASAQRCPALVRTLCSPNINNNNFMA